MKLTFLVPVERLAAVIGFFERPTAEADAFLAGFAATLEDLGLFAALGFLAVAFGLEGGAGAAF